MKPCLIIRSAPSHHASARPPFTAQANNGSAVEGSGVKRPSDVVLLYAARTARGFGDGFAAIVLPAYLIEIGFNPFEIGVVATSALLGSAVLTLAIGLLAPR